MKKLIVAAAGLILTGSIVSSASADAGVIFTGDARARGFYFQDYVYGELNKNNDFDTSEWNSRVRLKIKGESKGGAYAVARVRMADSTWDGAKDQTKATAQGSNIYTDYAYLGVPMGLVTVEAGLMPFDITPFSVWDARTDGVNIKYTTGMTTLMAFYQKVDEFEEASFVRDPVTLAVDKSADIRDDNDVDLGGILLNQKFDGGWGLVASVWYQNDQQTPVNDKTGVSTAAEVTGTIGTFGVLADAAWYQGDVAGTPDDPYGFYGQVAIPLGAFTLAGGVGMTKDGFVADGDFGPFIMLSDVSNIASGIAIGTGGDTNFAALVPSIKVSEQLTLTGVLAYADIDNPTFESAFEVSGSVAYAITDGATLTAELGYLDFDGMDNPEVGAGLILDVAF